MKTKFIKFMGLLLILVLIVGAVSVVSAAKYVAKPVEEKFEASTLFLAPGDLDADGKVNSSDYFALREQLLNNAASRYSDVNGDDCTDITDRVLQDENKVDFIADGKMNLKGKSIYSKDIVSLLSTGAGYKVTYNASGNIKIKLAGLDGVDITASGYTFKTPLNLSGKSIELYVIGNGTLEDLSIVRVNMDNDYAVN